MKLLHGAAAIQLGFMAIGGPVSRGTPGADALEIRQTNCRFVAELIRARPAWIGLSLDSEKLAASPYNVRLGGELGLTLV
jgi:hypothetical protein